MKSDENDQEKELVTKGILNLHVTYVGRDAHERTVHYLLQNLVERSEGMGMLTGGFDIAVEESTFDIKFEDQEKREKEKREKEKSSDKLQENGFVKTPESWDELTNIICGSADAIVAAHMGWNLACKYHNEIIEKLEKEDNL